MIRSNKITVQSKEEADVIEVNDLEFEYSPNSKIINKISFSIRKGDGVVILGENGSGKSTLFLCMLYLIPKFSGKIRIGGLDLSKKNAKEIRKKVGMLFQDSNDQLFLPTILEEISFGPFNLGVTGKELEERIDWTLESLNLLKFKQKNTMHLSHGEKRQIAFATIFAMKPDIYLLDEPFAGLDPIKREEFSRVLEKLHNNQKTIIMVSQGLDYIPNFFKRAIVIHEGGIIFDGMLRDLYTKREILKEANLRAPKWPKLILKLIEEGYFPENHDLSADFEDVFKFFNEDIKKL